MAYSLLPARTASERVGRLMFPEEVLVESIPARWTFQRQMGWLHATSWRAVWLSDSGSQINAVYEDIPDVRLKRWSGSLKLGESTFMCDRVQLALLLSAMTRHLRNPRPTLPAFRLVRHPQVPADACGFCLDPQFSVIKSRMACYSCLAPFDLTDDRTLRGVGKANQW